MLATYGRTIAYLRQQIAAEHFGIFLGPGATRSLGFPDWDELMIRVAKHPKVAAADLFEASGFENDRPAVLYDYFQSAFSGEANSSSSRVRRIEYERLAAWQKIVHTCLYQDVPTSPNEVIDRAGYLKDFLPLIRRSSLTINWGFGDAVQRLLGHTLNAEERRTTRGSATVYQPDVRSDPRRCVVYHPNGYVPIDLRDRTSERLRFPEDSPVDAVPNGFTGHFASLAFHLSRGAWLFLGASLSDPTLKHLLRQGSQVYPGQLHCHVVERREHGERDSEYEAVVRRTNFFHYGVVTLFLTSQEISALGKLLAMEESQFNELAADAGQPTVYRYYVTGPVSVGKSTTVSHFRSLHTLDEWLDQRAAGMEKDFRKLDEEELKSIDQWVAEQWHMKNLNVRDIHSGIVVVDRAPLDAFSFTPTNQWSEKAELTIRIVNEAPDGAALVPAHVVLLLGEPEIMAARSVARHKDMDSTYLSGHQELLTKVYRNGPGVTVLPTAGRTVEQVVKDVAWVIHMEEPYVEMDLQARLTSFREVGYRAVQD
jgi:hypothetical protein